MDTSELVPAAGRLSGEKLRAFVALEVPEHVKALLHPYLAAAASRWPEFRWVAAENLHVTLKFLGGVEPARLECLHAGLRRVDQPAFSLALERTGTFGGSRGARVVWLAVTGDLTALKGLALAVDNVSADCGAQLEERPYRPHLTLARARARFGAPVPGLAPLPDLPAWVVERMVIYESRVGRGGPVYVPLHTVALS